MNVTLESLDQKLDNLKELMTDHISEDRSKHLIVDDHTIHLDRLEQIEANRRWHIRALWTAMIAGAVGWLFPR
jgi:hypothetical protein